MQPRPNAEEGAISQCKSTYIYSGTAAVICWTFEPSTGLYASKRTKLYLTYNGPGIPTPDLKNADWGGRLCTAQESHISKKAMGTDDSLWFACQKFSEIYKEMVICCPPTFALHNYQGFVRERIQDTNC